MSEKLKQSMIDMFSNPYILQSIDNIIEELVCSHLVESVKLCEQTIQQTRNMIRDRGPTQYLLEDIEDCQKTIDAMNVVHKYYTGRAIKTYIDQKDDDYGDDESTYC